jgi:RNA polymerase-binding transcription factor DksA
LQNPANKTGAIKDASSRSIPEAWKWHYRTLVGLRARLLKDRGDQEAAAQAAEAIDLDGAAMADIATDEFDHDLALAMWSHEDGMLQEVDAAIQRILDGTYGFCQETGKNISGARLQAMPWTRYTRDVEARLEEEGAKPGPHLSRLKPIAPASAREETQPDETDNPGAAEEDEIPPPLVR